MRRYVVKVISCICLIALSAFSKNYAQTPNQLIPFSHQFYQKLYPSAYNPQTKFHSSIKGYYADDSLLIDKYASLMRMGVDTLSRKGWIKRKLFNEHLVDVGTKDYTFFLDFLPDFQMGKDFGNDRGTWLNTRGFQAGVTVGKKFSFYTNFFENQGKFAKYIDNFIQANEVVPGQMTVDTTKMIKDWNYASALLSFTPNKYINLTLGYDKNFIGDGYRSMLLSDVSANYSFFRVRASLGDVTYQTIFAYMLDPGAQPFTSDRRLGYRGKWSAMHYLDWNISNRLSLGLFQAVTWADAEPEAKRGFDFNYIHPFIFLRSVERANYAASPDKMRLGFNLKYELFAHTTLYGQFMLDEFVGREFFKSNGFWTNKWATQIGLKGVDLFGLKSLNYLAELNIARPYTYSHFARISNYSNYNQPLAHPFGANFKEAVGLLFYSFKRFDVQGQMIYARYGLDPEGLNYGKNIFKSYFDRVSDYNNSIAQGIGTNLYIFDVKLAYVLNPKYNLRLEVGGTLRNETNKLSNTNTTLFNVGLRSSFRNLYHDF